MTNEIQITILTSKLLEICHIYGLGDYPSQLSKDEVLEALKEVQRMISEKQ